MMTNEAFEDIRKAVKKELDDSRYIHTLGVAYTAECLAMRWGEELPRAYLAGLLHDSAKCIRREERLPLCEKWGISVTDTERMNTSLLHAKMGEYLAEKRYNVKDKGVLSAIRFHTTGQPGMSLLEKIIFTADYVEPNRDRAPELKKLRALAFTDLDRAVYEIAAATVAYLKGTARDGIDPMTEKTLDYYRELTEGAGKKEE